MRCRLSHNVLGTLKHPIRNVLRICYTDLSLGCAKISLNWHHCARRELLNTYHTQKITEWR